MKAESSREKTRPKALCVCQIDIASLTIYAVSVFSSGRRFRGRCDQHKVRCLDILSLCVIVAGVKSKKMSHRMQTVSDKWACLRWSHLKSNAGNLGMYAGSIFHLHIYTEQLTFAALFSLTEKYEEANRCG